MDVPTFLLITFLAAVPCVMMQDVEDTTVTLDIETTASTTTPRPQRNCTTAHEAAGTCVQRVSCEYGTGAIDYTLYTPSWYHRTCSSDEVCCPFQFIIATTIPKAEGPKENTTADLEEDI